MTRHFMQYNLAPGGKMYNPERDFAYNYPQLITCIINAFNNDYWPELVKVVEDAGSNFDGLCEAKDKYEQFLKLCCEDPNERVEDVLRRAGWHDVHPAAQAGFLAMMGTVMTGQLFMAIRDVTKLGDSPSPELKDLLAAGERVRRAMNGLSSRDDLKSQISKLVTSYLASSPQLNQDADWIQNEVKAAIKTLC